MRLFERYFYKEIAKIFILSLFASFFLFILIDYSTHMKVFLNNNLPTKLAIAYFASQLSLMAEILCPLSLAIATVKVLTQAMARNEITALASSAIPFRTILRPFLISGLIVSSLLLINFQWGYPLSRSFQEEFVERFFHHPKSRPDEIHSLFFKDNTLLIYQRYDPKKKIFSEIYWIKDLNDLYHMERLFLEKIPKAEGVEHFIRNDGLIVKKETSPTRLFPEIPFNQSLLLMATPPPLLSVSHLTSLLTTPFGIFHSNLYQAKVASLFYFRIASSTLPILAVLAISPFCLCFTRKSRTFLLFAGSLALLFLFFTLTRSLLILAEAQIIPPFWSILSPYFLAFGIFGKKYVSL